MQQSGRRSNRRAELEALRELAEALLDPAQISKRQKLLKASDVSKNRKPAKRKELRLPQGAIQEAILEVLREATGPIYTRDLCKLVEQKLKRSVSYDTVCSFMTVSAKKHNMSGIHRIRYGQYLLITEKL